MEITLESDLVLLRPIRESDAQELWANTASDDQLWNWVWTSQPIPHSLEDVRRVIKAMKARDIKIRERLDVLEIRTPLDLQESVMAPGGLIYGTSSNSASAAFLRTKNRSPINNLFCVGGSTHPGGGLPLVGISAEIVANAIGRAR